MTENETNWHTVLAALANLTVTIDTKLNVEQRERIGRELNRLRKFNQTAQYHLYATEELQAEIDDK